MIFTFPAAIFILELLLLHSYLFVVYPLMEKVYLSNTLDLQNLNIL